jgi:hypothetical protein
VSEELDALRRRLYAPDVTAEEVDRYRALAREPERGASTHPAGPQAQALSAQPPTSRRLRGVVVGLVTVALVLVAGVGVAAMSRPHPAPVPLPSSSRSSTPVPTPSSLDDSIVTVAAPVRASFVARLKAGRSAGVLRYFYDHPGQIPAQIRTTSRADSDERFGSGTAMVFLSPSIEAQKGGRLTVAVTLDRAASAQLRAIRADSGMQSFIERIDDGARGLPGLPMVRTVVYDGEAPTVIELTVPKGVRWDVVAVFTD